MSTIRIVCFVRYVIVEITIRIGFNQHKENNPLVSFYSLYTIIHIVIINSLCINNHSINLITVNDQTHV